MVHPHERQIPRQRAQQGGSPSREALADTGVALLLAVMTMYIILAWVFASYATPLIVLMFIGYVVGLGLIIRSGS